MIRAVAQSTLVVSRRIAIARWRPVQMQLTGMNIGASRIYGERSFMANSMIGKIFGLDRLRRFRPSSPTLKPFWISPDAFPVGTASQ